MLNRRSVVQISPKANQPLAEAKNMYYNVYVLESNKNRKRYIGITSKDPIIRLKEHNEGSNKFTRLNKPYELVYFELGFCKACALKREQFLKSGQGRKILNKIIQND